MSRIRLVERKLALVAFAIVGISIVFAVLVRNLKLVFHSSLPVADFYDKVSGTSGHGGYFGAMYIAFPLAVPSVVSALGPVVKADVSLWKRLGSAAVLAAVLAFLAYLCVFMPESTKIGGSRFSMMLMGCAASSILFGLVYGALFYSATLFSGMMVIVLRMSR